MFDQKQYNHEYYKRHQEEIKAHVKSCHHQKMKDPEYRKEQQLKRDLRHFGMPRDIIMRKTDGACYYCGKPASDIHHLNDDGRHHERLGKQPSHDTTQMVPVCKACHIDLNRVAMRANMKTKANGFWSRNYDECIECGRSDRRHDGHGLCVTCIARYRRRMSKGAGV